jgi:hypothetical protein
MLSDLSAFLGVISSCVPTNVVPMLVDIFDGVVIFANVYVICALSWVSMIGPDGLTLDFTREVVCSSV